MKPTVYIETSIVSYLTARPTTDAVVRGQQEITARWWRDRRPEFTLLTSQFVLDESSAGDSGAAAERLAVLKPITLLEITAEVEPLAERLLKDGALPAKARVDALHLAVATVHGISVFVHLELQASGKRNSVA